MEVQTMDAVVAMRLQSRAQRGDTNAFAALVEGYRNPAFRLARAAMQDRRAAIELLERAALEVWSARGTWRTDFAEIWMSAVARGIFDRIEAEDERLRSAESPLHEDRWGRELPEQGPIDDGLRHVIQAALALLPPTPRALLLLKDDAALSDSALAQASSLKVEVVRRFVHAARCALTRAIDLHLAGPAQVAAS